jgi:hypothetical protein
MTEYFTNLMMFNDEYIILCACRYICPVDPNVRMPMIWVDDLMRGLIALQEADESQLTEPEHGYCIPGLSFTPNELFTEIRKHYPGFLMLFLILLAYN